MFTQIRKSAIGLWGFVLSTCIALSDDQRDGCRKEDARRSKRPPKLGMKLGMDFDSARLPSLAYRTCS